MPLGQVAKMACRAAPLLLIAALTACYETKVQLFARDDAIAIAGIEGQYAVRFVDTVDRYSISRTDQGNDYRFVLHDEKHGHSDVSSGTLRVIPINDDLFLAQLALPRSSQAEADPHRGQFLYLILRVVRSNGEVVRVEELELRSDSKGKNLVRILARRDGADVWDVGYGIEGLSGSPAALKRFLRDLADYPLKPNLVFTRIH